MSDLKERLIKEFKDSYENSYQAFNEFVEDKIIENHGVYTMDKELAQRKYTSLNTSTTSTGTE